MKPNKIQLAWADPLNVCSSLIAGDKLNYDAGGWSIWSNVDDEREYSFIRHTCHVKMRYKKHYYYNRRESLITKLTCPQCDDSCPKDVLVLWNLLR